MEHDLKFWLCLMGHELPYNTKAGKSKSVADNIHGKSKFYRACLFLQKLMDKDLPVSYIYKKAMQAGFSKTLLHRVKTELKIKHYLVGKTTMWRRKDAAQETF